MEDITPQQLAQSLYSAAAPTIIDVREPFEYAYAHIEGAQLMPLGNLFEWAQGLDKEQEYVTQCHTGARSAEAKYLLQQMGFQKVRNLIGGIDAWSREVDPNVPRY
jgi:rhodanese-related sulfurtransferase